MGVCGDGSRTYAHGHGAQGRTQEVLLDGVLGQCRGERPVRDSLVQLHCALIVLQLARELGGLLVALVRGAEVSAARNYREGRQCAWARLKERCHGGCCQGHATLTHWHLLVCTSLPHGRMNPVPWRCRSRPEHKSARSEVSTEPGLLRAMTHLLLPVRRLPEVTRLNEQLDRLMQRRHGRCPSARVLYRDS